MERVERLESPPSASDETGSAAAFEAPPGDIDPGATDIAALATKPDTPPATSASAGESESLDTAVTDAADFDPQQISALTVLAEKGAPSLAVLASEFAAVADAILAALQTPDSEAGFFDRVLSYGGGLVKIRPIEPASGNDPTVILARMRVAVDSGDLAEALGEREALPPAGQKASRGWAARAADRLAIDRLVGEMARAPGAAEASGQAISQ